MDSPFLDPAKSILGSDPSLDDKVRADLWDVFHETKDPAELAQHLQPLAIPDDTKQKLFEAKQQTRAVAEPMGRTTEALHTLASIDPKVLDMAETHPNVLKALVAAVGWQETGAKAVTGASKKAEKGEDAAEPAPLVQPPRADGQAHFPPIPEGHHRILASDGHVHDIPAENIEEARKLDPNLHVLNP